MFTLHERLAADTRLVTDLEVCTVLLNNDSQYPWLVLVPREENCRDLFDVPYAKQAQMFAEIRLCHETLKKLTGATKMNVGALGNMVPQLHIHLIARFEDDAAWPKPVWGVVPGVPYDDAMAEALIGRIREALGAETAFA